MTRKLRDRVWWPRLDSDAKDTVKRCRGCLLVSRPNPPEPMLRRKMPDSKWTDLAMDYMGPLPSGEYLLVIVDYFSRFMVVKITKKITAQVTIDLLEPIFVNFGYPHTITLDNARQFIGKELEDYCYARKITLNHTTPYWPQANGEVERQNQTLLKALQISSIENRDWQKDLNYFLVSYNTTPHSTTGKTPTELLFGQSIRSKIPSVRDLEVAYKPCDEAHDRDAIAKEEGRVAEDFRRRARRSSISEGDTVVLKDQLRDNKLSSRFVDENFTVTNRSGNELTVRSQVDGRSYNRVPSHVKKVPDPRGDQTSDAPSSSVRAHNDPATIPTTITEDGDFNPRSASTPAVIKRSTRIVKQPEWRKDFV